MIPTNFKEKNKTLIKPSNMTEKECSSLDVFCDDRQCISLWKATWRERLKFLLYGKIWVYVFSGVTQPPIALSTNKTVFKKEKE